LKLKLVTNAELHYTSGALNRRDAAQVCRTNVDVWYAKDVVIEQIVRLSADLYALTFPRQGEVLQESRINVPVRL
jgi:hypothetical protein